ncbi:MAG: hypothetical protein K2M06_01430 [Muribaculaceae bacterium]|nr:hypothetical protein [Muribaculaceae bacterium]
MKISFTTSLPSTIGSRAYSDGTTATALSWAIYETGTKTPLLTGSETFSGLKTTVSTTLVTGKTYDFVFWAQNPSAPYEFDAATQAVTIDYSSDAFTANNEQLDGFYKSVSGYQVKGSVNETYILTRPFAQINIGTTDFAEATAAGIDVASSTLTVASYSTFDLMSGEVSGDATAEFKLNAIPGSDEAFPVEGCKYLAMAYVLMPADKQTVDVTYNLSPDASAPVTFGGVPVQRNYRTNIYGALLTNPAIFNVEINPAYEGENEYDLSEFVAPGVMLDSTTKTYTVLTPVGLQWISSQSDGKAGAYSGYTIKLGANLDMTDVAFTPIARGTYFSGTIDGNGYTISNLTVSDPGAAGLVASNRGWIKNLTLKDVNVSGNFKAGAFAGDATCGYFENCTVDGGTVVSTPQLMPSGKYDDGNNVGGITGYLSAEPRASITGCTVSNLTLKAYRTVGAIAGTLNQSGVYVSNNKAENCTVIANQLGYDNYDGAPRAPQAEQLFGRLVGGATPGEGNVATDVVVKVYAPDASGNISVGDADTYAAVVDAVNSGNSFQGKTITLTSDLDFAGKEMAPMGMFVNTGGSAAAVNAPFMGTFDGGNHTVSNFTTVVTDFKTAAGFFGLVSGGAVIKNLTLKDIKVTGTAYTGGLIGKADKGSSYVTVSGVTIDGATILSVPAMGADGEYDGGNNVGGLIGITQYGMDVQNCTVKGASVTGYAKVGGMFGGVCNMNQSGATNHTVYENNKVEDTSVTQSLTNAYESSVPATIGEIYGQLFGSALPASNTATGVTVVPAN